MTAIFCNQCGHRNPEGSNFCSSCGAVLERHGEAESSNMTTITLSAVELGDEELIIAMGDIPETGVLVVRRGPTAGSRFVLEKEVTTVGRHPDSDIFLDDVTVSRRHAEVLMTPERFSLRDVGSLNGTYLNRERIEQAEIHSGDVLQVGKFRLVFLAEAKGS